MIGSPDVPGIMVGCIPFCLIDLFAGALAVILALFIPGNTHIMLAAILAASFGFALRRSLTTVRDR